MTAVRVGRPAAGVESSEPGGHRIANAAGRTDYA